MRRLALIGASVVILGGGVFAQAAAAQGYGPSGCKFDNPGEYVSFVAQTVGHSAENNPGNAKDPLPPDVKTFCNPSLNQ